MRRVQNLYRKIVMESTHPVIYRSLFDKARSEKLGYNQQTYDGHGNCQRLSELLKAELDRNKIFSGDIGVFKSVTVQVKHRSANEVRQLKLPINTHSFLLCDKTLIIDPSYKQLLITKTGHNQKLFSPYAEYLYGLPPIFMGTIQDMRDLISKLGLYRSYDLTHQSDFIADDWYENTQMLITDRTDPLNYQYI